jgi:predicted membrane-bound dolichyl-phosphate-mannose-protein mannosyltransferase
MNVIEILARIGWDVYNFDYAKNIYEISLSEQHKDHIRKQIKAGKMRYNAEMNEIFIVEVSEVSFSESGNLYVEFKDINTGDIVGTYEYNNMSDYELF